VAKITIRTDAFFIERIAKCLRKIVAIREAKWDDAKVRYVREYNQRRLVRWGFKPTIDMFDAALLLGRNGRYHSMPEGPGWYNPSTRERCNVHKEHYETLLRIGQAAALSPYPVKMVLDAEEAAVIDYWEKQ
jgi:hypothetical protein